MVGASVTMTISNLSLTQIKNLQIPLPPLAEQRRIAAILDQADALRAKRRAALAKLDTLLQATFLEMFGDPVTNPMGLEQSPLSECMIGKASNGYFAKNDKYGEEGTPVIWIGDFLDKFYAQIDGLKRVSANPKAIEKNRVGYAIPSPKLAYKRDERLNKMRFANQSENII